jgi:hypothetical protein
MDKQITDLMDTARDVLKRTDVIDQLYALDTVLFASCPSDPSLIATHTMNHVAFMASLAHTPADLDRILALMAKVQDEIVATKRQILAQTSAAMTVH